MTTNKTAILLFSLFIFLTSACGQSPQNKKGITKVGMVLDTGGEKDRGYNEYSLLGAREASKNAGIAFDYIASDFESDYEKNIDKLINENADLIITVGFSLASATAKAAQRYPDVHFTIIDYAYLPGRGCPENVSGCYTVEGGLPNVTSIVFAEDQPAYLAGVLSGCMTQTGVIAIVAGSKIPPVVRLAEGFENGATSVNPGVETLTTYIPSFNDTEAGYLAAMDFISKGADILFCPAGTTGLGGLRAAEESRVMAVGVDVDQYLTFPEAGSVLITSVMKNVDVAARVVVNKFVAGRLESGIQSFDLTSHAVGIAPYHEWEQKVPQQCKDRVAKAAKKIIMDPGITLRKDR